MSSSTVSISHREPVLQSQSLMARETRSTLGAVPRSLFGDPLGPTTWQVLGEEFLLRGEGHHYFHYRKGAGITVERGPDADLSEESLWMNGSVYAAIASLNGLLPIHASAVAVKGRVIAFTGPGGAGKSTLVASLGRHDLPLFCDDTLILDLSDPDEIMCLPGHKRLKLRPDSLPLTGAIAQERVSRTVDKVYALPVAGDVRTAMPIAELIFLEEGSKTEILPITGAERFTLLNDGHQTSALFAAANEADLRKQFEHRMRLAKQVEMTRFIRPCDRSHFPIGVKQLADYISARSGHTE